MARYRPDFKTVLLCIGLFIFFLILRFPYQNFRGYLFGQIFNATRILIVAEDIYPSFFGWPGVGIRKVDITLPLGDSELDLSSDKVIARVGLGGLFPPVPSFSLNVLDLKKGGDLYLKFSQSGTRVSAYVEAEEVELEQLKFSALPQSIVGKLNADSDLKIDTADLSKTVGKINLDTEKLKLPMFNMSSYGFVIPSIKIGAITSKIRVQNGVAEFNEFKIGGKDSDISGSITGDIRLGRDLLSSAANILIRLQFSESLLKNPQAETLVSFLKSFRNEKTGAYAIKCSKPFIRAAECLLVPETVVD